MSKRQTRKRVIRNQGAEDWAWLDAIAGKLDDDFVAAVDEECTEQNRSALQKQQS